jgi:epoxyqueuosine reductase
VLFKGSAVKRIGYDRFMRNVLIAAGNSGDSTLVGTVAEKLKSSSALVRAMAVWALGRLLSFDSLADLAQSYLPGEADDMVKSEWAAATGVAPARAMAASAVDLKEGLPP